MTPKQRKILLQHGGTKLKGREIQALLGVNQTAAYKLYNELRQGEPEPPPVPIPPPLTKKEEALLFIQSHLDWDIATIANELHINVDDLSALAWNNLHVKLKGDVTVYGGEYYKKKAHSKGEYSNKPISPIVEEYYRKEEEIKRSEKKRAVDE